MAARHRCFVHRPLVSVLVLLTLIASSLPIGTVAPGPVAAAAMQTDATPVDTGPAEQETPAAPTPEPSPTPEPTATSVPTAPATDSPAATATATGDALQAAAVATLIVHVRDGSENPLPGACASLWTDAGGGTRGARIAGSRCDAHDFNDDGNTQLEYDVEDTFAGTFVLGLYVWPYGYWPPPDVLVTLIAGQTVEVTFVLPPAATIRIRAQNAEGQDLPGACYRLHDDVGGGQPGGDALGFQLCDQSDQQNDGVTTIRPEGPGDFVVVETTPPKGYVLAGSVPVAAHQSAQVIDVNAVHVLGGKVVVNVVDENGAPLPGACFHAGIGAFTPYSGCDEDDGANDGTTSVVGLPAGDYTLTNSTPPTNYSQLPAQAFTIALGQTLTFNLAGKPYGTILILKKTPENVALPGACFRAFPTTFVGPVDFFVACDDDSDGTISIRVPEEADYNLVETKAPAGYLAADPVLVQVESNETTQVEIVDPLLSTLVIHAVNVSDAPVDALCWRVASIQACDKDDGATDGLTHLTGLHPGEYDAVQTTIKSGYGYSEPTPFTIGVMETLDLTIVIPQPAPKIVTGPTFLSVTQTAATIYWETDQKATGVVDYGLSQNLGRIRPRTQPAPATGHTVELSPLEPGTLYYFRVASENVNGEVESAIFPFRTPPAAATAKLSVTKTNSDRSQILPGACFDVYKDRGGGVLGAWVDGYCDKYDTAPMNGKVFFPALVPGAYVLVEVRSPDGYALAAKRKFTIADGQTLRLSVQNSQGGALLTIKTRTGAGKLLRGTCYSVYSYAGNVFGDIVASGCDDYDGNNGYTPIGNLRAGTYWVEQSYWPDGYLPADGQKLVISTGQTTAALTFTSFSETWGDNIEFQAIDSNGKLVPGACFVLFGDDGALAACDWSDGNADGRTFFVDVDPGSYTALEYHAPKGYKVGKRSTFNKTDNVFHRARFTQSAGGVRVSVKTLKGSTSTPLLDACYGLFKKPASGSTWPAVAFWCDGEDGSLNGTTFLDGIPAGTYTLVQTYTPPGYAAPADKLITVGSTATAVTVRTYAGVAPAGASNRYPESIPGPVLQP